MIDIKVNNLIRPSIQLTKSESDNINNIFEEADKSSEEKREKTTETPKKEKKSFVEQLKTQIKIFCIVFVIGFVILAICVISQFGTFFSDYKESVLAQYSEHYEEIANSDDNSLTVEEYYQKKAMLLLTKEDLEYIFSQNKNVIKITNLLNLESNKGISILPKNKQAEFESIFKEFNDYVASGGDPNAPYKLK